MKFYITNMKLKQSIIFNCQYQSPYIDGELARNKLNTEGRLLI